jgi:hypothetical protein
MFVYFSRNMHFGPKPQHCRFPVLQGPKVCSRLDGVSIFRNGACLRGKTFRGSTHWFSQSGFLASTACRFCMFMTCVVPFVKHHTEPLENKMSNPPAVFAHFRVSLSLLASRLLEDILEPPGAFRGLLEPFVGLPGTSMTPPGTFWGSAVRSRT